MSVNSRTNDFDKLVSQGWPTFLAKAATDQWIYLAGLRNGTTVLFDLLEPGDTQWVTLAMVRAVFVPGVPPGPAPGKPAEFCCGRGVQVRLSDILWISDGDS